MWGCPDGASRGPVLLQGHRKGRGLPSCHNSECAAAVGVGFLRGAVWLTSLMRVPALAFAIRPKGPGLAYLLAQLPSCRNSERRRCDRRWIRARGCQLPPATPALIPHSVPKGPGPHVMSLVLRNDGFDPECRATARVGDARGRGARRSHAIVAGRSWLRRKLGCRAGRPRACVDYV